MAPTALVIDDDPEILDAVEDILKSMGHDCDRAVSVESARECLERGQYGYVLLDLEIPVIAGKSLPRIQNGENLLAEIIRRSGTRRMPVIVMTAHGTDGPDLAVDVMKMGAVDYVTKPFKTAGRTLDNSIREALARQDGASAMPPQQQEDDRPQDIASATPTASKRFGGGTIVFHVDRVELCGVAICSGPRSSSKRIVLELLSQKRADGAFAAFTGEELENHLKNRGRQGTASGLIRDLRQVITSSMRNQAGIVCGPQDVILSGGPGYRFTERLSVQYADQSAITDIDASENVRNVPNDDVRDGFDVRDDSAARRDWILLQLANGVELKGPDVAKHFKCSAKTVQRDLTALKDEGKIEYVGTPRSGYYQLCQPPESAQ